jgi:hypothetical protein
MKVIEIEKAPTWVDHIESMEVGVEITAFYAQANYLRNIISNEMKLRHPERHYKTRSITKEGIDYILIERLADREEVA